MQVFSCTALMAQENVKLINNQNIADSEPKKQVLTQSLYDIEDNRVGDIGKPALDRYIDIYIDENQAIRTKNAKALVIKRLEEQEKDLLYPSMYKALGYESWNQAVSIPPELSSRRFAKRQEALNLGLLTRLQGTWALLDSTLFRMGYVQDAWVEPLIQRNLILSAIHSWYRGGFNEEYIAALDKLNADTDVTLKSVAKIRSNLKKKAWNDTQIALLKLKSDNAALTQFHLLGVSDVFLNTSLPSLPKDEVAQVLKLNTKTSCFTQTKIMEKGLELLGRRFPKEMKLIKSSSFDDTQSAWQISKVAHDLSKMALLFPHKEQAQYAIYALTDLVLERILKLNQARLNNFLSKTDSFFQDKGPVLRFRGINVLQGSLHEIFELTLLDYLLAGERASFANLMMHRKCVVSKSSTGIAVLFTKILNNQYTANLDVERFAAFSKERINQHALLSSVEHKNFTYVENKIPLNSGINSALLETVAKEAVTKEAVTKEAVTKTKSSSGAVMVDVEAQAVAVKNIKDIDNIRAADFLTAESILEKRNIQLLSEEGIKEVFKGKGYTMQVVSTTSPNDVEYIVKRYKKGNDDVFVYLSKVTVEDESISIFKILVGSHKAENVSKSQYLKLLDTAKKRKAFLKPYSFVRADAVKAS